MPHSYQRWQTFTSNGFQEFESEGVSLPTRVLWWCGSRNLHWHFVSAVVYDHGDISGGVSSSPKSESKVFALLSFFFCFWFLSDCCGSFSDTSFSNLLLYGFLEFRSEAMNWMNDMSWRTQFLAQVIYCYYPFLNLHRFVSLFNPRLEVNEW